MLLMSSVLCQIVTIPGKKSLSRRIFEKQVRIFVPRQSLLPHFALLAYFVESQGIVEYQPKASAFPNASHQKNEDNME